MNPGFPSVANGAGEQASVNGSAAIPLVDGSWELRVLVTDLQVERSLRVKGDLHIGGVMIKLVDDLDIAMDWSDHAIWWPEKNLWLDKTRWTLDQYNITADAIIHFTPMHKTLRVQLPDLRYIDCHVDFSIKTFNAVMTICSELEIRHPEELSLCKPVEEEHLKFNYGSYKRQQEEKKRRVTLGSMPNAHGQHHSPHHHVLSTTSLLDLNQTPVANNRPDTNTFIGNSATLGRKVSTLSWSNMGNGMGSKFRSLGRNGTLDTPTRRKSEQSGPLNGTFRSNGHNNSHNYSNGQIHISGPISPGMAPNFPGGTGSSWSLAISPPPTEEARYSMVRPRNIVERARLNVAWLDSSLSLMEQGIRDFDTLLLRFKFYAFYDLNPKSDPVRINLIYEQAKWQILNEGIDCTEEEMLLFAALQLQVGLQANVPQPSDCDEAEDDVDAALNDLQISLEGGMLNENGRNNHYNDILTVPSLRDHLRYLRPKRFTLKGYKRSFFTLQDLQLKCYKTQNDADNIMNLNKNDMSQAFSINLKGCEVSPDVNISQGKYGIKLSIPSHDGMSDLWLKCETESQYAKWMAACRLAAKGKTMADRGYDSEVKSIQAFLSMQHPASLPVINPATLDINVEEYVAPRFLRKLRSKLRHKILEAHTNVKDLNLLEAKMNFIKAWQSLPDYGISLFVVRFHGEKRDELLGVAFNRLMRMNLNSGDHIKTWRFNTIKAWNINWETKHMMIQLGDDKKVIFKTLSAECKVVHEFIGGYIFLSMRSKDANQTLDEEMFHKLTGGWQ